MAPESEWASHIPILQSIIETYKPKFGLELGIGNFSTKYVTEIDDYLGIENNEGWFKSVSSQFKNKNFIYHKLPEEIQLGTPFHEVSESNMKDVMSFYESIDIPKVKPNLIFIDHYRSLRAASVNYFSKKFDIILYHDCQPAGVPHYNYELINSEGFTKLTFITDISWTGVLVKEVNQKLFDNIEKHIKTFRQKYKDINYAKLIKNE